MCCVTFGQRFVVQDQFDHGTKAGVQDGSDGERGLGRDVGDGHADVVRQWNDREQRHDKHLGPREPHTGADSMHNMVNTDGHTQGLMQRIA